MPSPILSSTQETSDEGSVQFDSSSEESKIRYIVRVVPNKWAIDGAVTIEVVNSNYFMKKIYFQINSSFLLTLLLIHLYKTVTVILVI